MSESAPPPASQPCRGLARNYRYGCTVTETRRAGVHPSQPRALPPKGLRDPSVSDEYLPSNTGDRAVVQSVSWWLYGGPTVALALWIASLSRIEVRNIPDVGLVGALPTTFFASLIALSFSFAALVFHAPRSRLPWLVHIVSLILVLHGTPSFIYEVARFPWSYKHVGVTSFIQLNGAVNPGVDAYHNWPGFFALSAFLTELMGYADAIGIARYGQLVFNVLYLGPLLAVFGSLFPSPSGGWSRRATWIGAWFFYLTTWISQDYFAPQAIGYLFDLTALAIVLSCFPARPLVADAHRRGRFWRMHSTVTDFLRRDSGDLGGTGRANPGMAVLVVLLMLAIVATHQLTPFMLTVSLAALAVTRRTSLFWAPIALVALIIVWTVTGAAGFMSDAQHWSGSLGDIVKNMFASGVGLIVPTDRQQSLAASFPKYLTLLVWSCALLGAIKATREGNPPVRAGLLAVAPLSLKLVHAYGGEMILRAYFFSLPFAVALAVNLAIPKGRRLSRSHAIGLGVVSAVVSIGFIASYYGNERLARVLPENVRISERLYSEAPRSAAFVGVSVYSLPYPLKGDYPNYAIVSLLDRHLDVGGRLAPQDLASIKDLVVRERRPAAYLILSSQEASFRTARDIVTPERYATFGTAVKTSSDWRLFARDGSIEVYIFNNPALARSK